MLQDITGVEPTKIPLDDKETMSIFSSTKALGVIPEQIETEIGTYGIPEFGTKFVRGMLLETKPTTFDELIKISGLSHGTDVWLDNAQVLINNKIATLKEVISCRDDIMNYLISLGIDDKTAFDIMKFLYLGKASKYRWFDKWQEYKNIMKKYNVPEWYISSCEKIKYLFPKAHATSYVINAFRIAWFKVHYPLAFYSTIFSIKAIDDFDASCMIYGKEKVKNKMKEIDSIGTSASKKEMDIYPVLELVLEMYERGFEFLPINLYKSHWKNFIIEDGKIRPPLNSIDGMGQMVAENIYNEARKGKFSNIEELRNRTTIRK